MKKTRSKTAKKTIYLSLAESINQNCENFIQLLKSVRKKISIESVHEIRVSSRKLEACLEVAETLGIRRKNLARYLHHIRKIHGPLRNIHIELEAIKKFENLEKQAKSKPFKFFLKSHEKKAVKKLLNKLEKISVNKQHLELQKVVEKLLLKDTPITNEKAFNTIDAQNRKATMELKKTKQAFSPNSQKSIHAIRIAAKKLRYRYEILKPAMSFENVSLQQLRSIQDAFGEIQNNFVLQNSIRKYIHKHSLKKCKSVLKLQTSVAKEHQLLMASVRRMKGMSA